MSFRNLPLFLFSSPEAWLRDFAQGEEEAVKHLASKLSLEEPTLFTTMCEVQVYKHLSKKVEIVVKARTILKKNKVGGTQFPNSEFIQCNGR